MALGETAWLIVGVRTAVGPGVGAAPRRPGRRPVRWCALWGGFLGVVLVGLGAVVGVRPAWAASDPTTTLAQRYAPIVVVREQAEPCGPGEPYRPTTVETVLGRQGVVLRGPGGERVRAPTAQDMAGKGPNWYLDYPGNPLAPGCVYETWFRKTSVGVAPTVYAHVASDPHNPGELALQYWFFYTYNDWNDKHEGDWEMVQVVLRASSAEPGLGGRARERRLRPARGVAGQPVDGVGSGEGG